MLLWIAFAVLTAAVVAAVVRPLSAAPDVELDAAAADLAVYRDQLNEIDTDRDRGLVSEVEAVSARNEVSRRLLRRAGAEPPAAATKPSRTRLPYVAPAIVALVPILSVAIYLAIGSPALPGLPLEARRTAPLEKAPVTELIARVEERLRQHPDDGQGWDRIAPIYLAVERYGDAAESFKRAIKLLGESPERLAGLAQASLLANNGIVDETVRKIAGRLLVLDAKRFDARFWLVLAKEQDGDLAGAVTDYKAVMADAPQGAHWRAGLERRVAELEVRIAGKAPEAAGPTEEDVAALSPADRAKMINSMVDRLATRLKANGRDLPGWLQLARAYKVLGREADAKSALAQARTTFAGDAASLKEIETAERSLGLGS